jgi:hypothetical protein
LADAVDLNRLHPIFRYKLELILRDMAHLGWQPHVYSAVRTTAEQAEKVRLGYSKTMLSDHVTGVVHILPEGRESFTEFYANAADIADRRYGWSGLASNKNFKFWKDLGSIAQKHGCGWGGNWKMRDVAHVN